MLEFLSPSHSKNIGESLKHYYDNHDIIATLTTLSEKRLFVGTNSVFIVDRKGDVYARGSNYCGELGLGDTTDRRSFTLVPTPIPARCISIHPTSSAIVNNGIVYLCGYDEDTHTNRSTFASFPTPEPILFTSRTLLLTTSGKLVTWGGETITFPPHVTTVTEGDCHCLMLTAEGKVYGSGSNYGGRMGMGRDEILDTSPTLIPTPEPILFMTAGSRHTFLISTTGRLYATGYNDDGQLGLGDTYNRFSFTLVPTPELVRYVTSSHNHTFIISVTGRLYCCGSNFNGQLGLGDTDDRSSFTFVPTPEAVACVETGYRDTYLLSVSERVYCSGGLPMCNGIVENTSVFTLV